MQECDGCDDGVVSDHYHKVFSDNDGVLPQCPECSTQRERKEMHT